MSRLVFIRHAETDMTGTFCGHSNPPINSRGRAQISNLITCLASEPFDAIYSSDLRRAMTTAETLAKKSHIPVILSPRLREIHFGAWEGLSWNEVEQRDKAYARQWVEAFPQLPTPGGETCAAFERRVLEEVEHLLRFAGDTRIAIVAHGGVMRVVLQTLLGYSEQQSWQLTKSYCSSFAFSGDDTSQQVSR